MTPATKKWKSTYIQQPHKPHNPSLPILVQTQRFWYPVKMVWQESFLSHRREKNQPITVGKGHVIKFGSEMLCGREAATLHEAEYKRINEEKPDGEKIDVHSYYSDKPIGRNMCAHCLAIYKKMPDWKRWADAVESYKNAEIKNVKPKAKKKSGKKSTSKSTKSRRTDTARNAPKAKKRS